MIEIRVVSHSLGHFGHQTHLGLSPHCFSPSSKKQVLVWCKTLPWHEEKPSAISQVAVVPPGALRAPPGSSKALLSSTAQPAHASDKCDSVTWLKEILQEIKHGNVLPSFYYHFEMKITIWKLCKQNWK